MTINLYNYYSKDNIENVFCWSPNQEQWWITGFNPNFTSSDPEIMVTLGSVDFTGHQEMYWELKNNIENDLKLKEFVIFDDNNFTAWILW